MPLITVEGIDGSGKSTLVEKLQSLYPEAYYTCEPKSGTWLGDDVVREAISNEGHDVSSVSIFFLFLAEHADHVNNYVRPRLEDDELVVCDRYVDSRYVYQTRELADEVEGDTLDWIRTVQEQKWTEMPDKTILLDIPVEVSMERLDGGEIFEKKDKLRDYRNTYLMLAENNDRYEVVDATQKPSAVVEECRQIVNRFY
jgi:dTMP kinase